MIVSIILADDQTSMREGLRKLLEKYDEFDVVAEADSGESTINLVSACKPDIVVMNAAMPGMNCSEATRQILAKAPGAKVIALAMSVDRGSVVEMLQAGTSGYLMKERACEELVDAIHEVVAGNTYLSPPVLGEVIGEYVHKQLSEKTPVFSILTTREREVLQLIAEGRSTAQIAAAMVISKKTVETHRQHITEKLNIRGIAELTRYAIREGITHL